MQFERLDLIAFGPFTDFSFDFSECPAGLHIVYGANEAGKSSSLRGLKALLFGFDERTPDNHLHNNDRLRVAGRLRNAQGESLELVRRKGRKGTLLSPQGDVLDDTVLLPYLGGISTEIFDTLFGIDHRALVQGGQDILEQKGDVGQALFAASLGTHTVHRVLQALESEAADLFRNKGSTQTINALVKNYRDLQGEMRSKALRGREWDKQRRELDSIHSLQADLDEQLRELRLEQHRLQRWQRVMPLLADFDRAQAQLNALGDVVILAAGFATRHRELRQALVTVQANVERSRQERTALQESLAAVPADNNLLGVQSTLDGLREQAPQYREARAAIPALESEHAQSHLQLEQLLAGLGLAESDTVMRTVENILQQRKPLIALTDQASELSRAQQLNSQRQQDCALRSQRLKRTLAELGEVADTQWLRSHIRQAHQASALGSELQRCEQALTEAQSELAQLMARFAVDRLVAEDLARLPVPRREQVVEHDRQNTYWQQQQLEAIQRQRELQEELTQLGMELEALVRAGDVPTDADLQSRRDTRDQQWQSLRTAGWQGDNGLQVDDSTERLLLDRYEVSVTAADTVADRLRREAGRVERKAQLEARRAGLQARLSDVQQRSEESDQQLAQQASDWLLLWQPSGIRPESPATMLNWLDDWEKLTLLVTRIEQNISHRDSLQTTLSSLRQALCSALRILSLPVEDGEPLSLLVEYAQQQCERLEQLAERRASLQEQLADLEAERDRHQQGTEQLEKDWCDWQQRWQHTLADTAWPGQLTPENLHEQMASLTNVQATWRTRSELAQRLQQAQQTMQTFEALVQDLVHGLLDARWQQRSVDAQLEQLLYQLSQERDYQVRRNTLVEQLKRTERDGAIAQARQVELQAELRLLCDEAGVNQPEQLEQAERNSAEYLALQDELKRLQGRLFQESPGISLEDMRGQIASMDLDALPGELDSVMDRLEALDVRRKDNQQAYGRANKEFELLQGGETVADLAIQAQSCLADIRQHSEQFVRCRVAAALLRYHIERFRQHNQGPLVRRASHHFRQLTCDHYSHLKVDFTERDEPVLMGVRDNAELNVLGMSAGTRDQLYLALRLAALERYLESSEPLPFIVDDILIEFDDQRSLAALHSLSQLAERTQVILFTHHSRIVEQVKHLKGNVRLHELSAVLPGQ